MTDLSAADFDEYFRKVHGHEPYPWQSRLTRQVLEEDGWPDVIDLPTGVGKTAVLDTAIFALAVRPDISPRRIVFVIDRRIVVDQVFKRAQIIRDTIATAEDGVLGEMHRLLSELTDADEPLGVAALRGGVPIDGEWARRPDQPWVMVSTVDQFGSRLLFRGYGVSPRMRPVHAGLAGNDCLVILDEVHLSTAFAATLRDVSSDGAVPLIRAAGCLPRRFKIIEMSATPTNASGRRFELHDADLEASPRLKQIADAPKRARLVEVGGTRPPHESVPKRVLDIVKRELREHETSVGVIVNRVRTARETCDILHKEGISVHLVTGRMRPIDRALVLDEITTCVDPDRPSPTDERTVVVATQAIEVGADFSFDALITEAAPVDSLSQRLGRLDRRGALAADRAEPARCWILGVASALNPKRPDPVYEYAAHVAWSRLQDLAEEGEIDVGSRAGILAGMGMEAQAPKSEAPLLLPTHVGAWAQTSPQPIVDPPIGEFLHGKERQQEPDVSVVWRWDRTERALSLVPPRPAEYLSVPVSAVKSWLRGAAEAPVSDTASALVDEETSSAGGTRHGRKTADPDLRGVVRWTRRDDVPAQEIQRADAIQPGDVIVVDPMLGGLRNGTWDPGFRPSAKAHDNEADGRAEPVADLGDAAQVAHAAGTAGASRGVRATLRLDPRLLGEIQVEGVSLPSPKDELTAPVSTRVAVDAWLEGIHRLPSDVPWLATAVGRLRRGAGFDIEVVESEHESAYYVLVERSVDPSILDESDNAPSLTGAETPLRCHLEGVGSRAADYGVRLRLPDDVVDDLRLAGELHDLGKIDHRFQAQLHGHDPVRMAELEEPLAKSLPGARPQPGAWPPVRHEFNSVALAESHPAILEEAHDPDLVLHLVGTHHGFGRPLPQIKMDDEPADLEVVGRLNDEGFRLSDAENGQHVDSGQRLVRLRASSDLAETPLALDMADRFWRLQERYGHHGLAWLEAILRLADHQQSAEEAR
jgi:CRISPR-associated endonuclease/helicase Cas3